MGEQSVGANGAWVSGSAYFNGQKKKALPTDKRREVPTGIPTVLQVLLQAQLYAQMLKRDVWEFALELPSLCLTGLSINDLRWLTCMGYAEHAEEINSQENDRRAFRSIPRLTFTQQTCFVLTPEGVGLAREILDSADLEFKAPKSVDLNGRAKWPARGISDRAALSETRYGLLSPHWDNDRRELRLGGVLVKQYKLPSPNQETILTAFEEEGWPPRIDDPLPQVYNLNPKRRLHDTIKSLNRYQKSRAMRFMGDGRGVGILWELISQTSST